MEMEIDSNVEKRDLELQFWYLNGKEDMTRKNVKMDFNDMNLDKVKECAIKENNSYASNIGDIEIISHGKILKSDSDLKNVANRTVLNIIKKTVKQPTSQGAIGASSVSREHVVQVASLLRTAFFRPNFLSALNKLGESEKLDNIFTSAPGLEDDPIGIAMIQNPAVLFHLTDFESLRKVSLSRPWVLEALSIITAEVIHEKGPSGSAPLHSRFGPIFEGEDEDMDDGDEDVGLPRAGPSGSPLRPITREQLAAALNSSLNSLAGLGMSPAGNLIQGQSSALRDFIQSQRGSQPTAANPEPSPNALSSESVANLQSLFAGSNANSNSSAGPAAGVLTTELVARAMSEALRNMRPEQRAQQFQAIRNLATQLQQSSPNNSGAPAQTPPPVVPPSDSVQPSAAVNSLNTNGAAGYQEQLAQMREVGITDERLSIMALRVSDGEVATAIELIFSGWQGEGADPQV